MATIRTFIALDMPADIKAALEKYMQPLKSMRSRVSWVKPENMHLTLKFLGDTPADRLEAIAAALQEAVAMEAVFTASIEGSGVFPKEDYPRVLWVGVNEQTGALLRLAKALDESVHPFGFAKEKRIFAPHLTIGRAKDTRIPEVVSALLEKPFAAMPATFYEIIFMKSELRPTGSIYTPLRRLALGKN